jgi:hypothetical protein
MTSIFHSEIRARTQTSFPPFPFASFLNFTPKRDKNAMTLDVNRILEEKKIETRDQEKVEEKRGICSHTNTKNSPIVIIEIENSRENQIQSEKATISTLNNQTNNESVLHHLSTSSNPIEKNQSTKTNSNETIKETISLSDSIVSGLTNLISQHKVLLTSLCCSIFHYLSVCIFVLFHFLFVLIFYSKYY